MSASRRYSPTWTMARLSRHSAAAAVTLSILYLPLYANILAFPAYKTTMILLDGKRVKLQLWDTSGQGRFCTIIRSYSRGAQGVLLVYDITNRWSFDGLDRWLKEVDEQAPGVPKVLIGNRLHLAFNRKVGVRDAQSYADKHSMAFFEVSPLCNFNITESFCELSRMALQRNGMERLWRSNKGTQFTKLTHLLIFLYSINLIV